MLGYCTNVHAGNTVDEAIEQLKTHAVEVKRLVSPDEPLDVGLWLPHAAVRAEFGVPPRSETFARDLSSLGIRAFTMNAFPFGDFHGDVVKHKVYEPSWDQAIRVHYSLIAAQILHGLAPTMPSASVSTLPIGWRRRNAPARGSHEETIIRNLHVLAAHLRAIEEQSGRRVTVDLEPEPGCMLDTAEDVIDLFERIPKFPFCDADLIRRYVGVCHDVCHAAVMFEDQAEVLKRYADAGIRVNKVQISNAPRIALDGDRQAAFEMLRRFVEPRYLHQTMVTDDAGQWFFEDLPDAFSVLDDPREVDLSGGEWRVHFHVPLYLDSIGALATTQDQILPAIRAAREYHDCKTFEVETYAWGVLPDELKTPTLAEGIARELRWVMDLAAHEGIS